MENRYAAVSLKKIDINKRKKVYFPRKIIYGNIDPTTGMLFTKNGNSYKKIDDYSENDNQTSGYYYMLQDLDNINFETFDTALTRIAQHYSEAQKNVFYYTEQLDDGSIIIKVIDFSRTEENKDDEVLDDEAITNNLNETIQNIIYVQHPQEELIDLIARLINVRETVDIAIETAESNATEQNNESLVEEALQSEQPAPTRSNIDIRNLYKTITQTIIAQDEAARRTIVEISRLLDMDTKEYGILLTGDTGVGKTLLMNLISKYIKRPFLKIDSTQLTAPGYVGKSLEQYLWELYEKCGKDKELTESAIVYFDEIDKKGSNKKGDINGKGVQDTLLRFIEGEEYIAAKNPQQVTADTSVPIKTDNMIMIASGAFLDVYKSQRKKNPIGFYPQQQAETSEQPTAKDFIDVGQMSAELMGRLPIIIHLHDLDLENMKRIIIESKKSPLLQQQKVFKNRGVILSASDEYISAAAQLALDKKLGARGLNDIITTSTWQAYEKTCIDDSIEEVILTDKTATDPSSFQLVKKRGI